MRECFVEGYYLRDYAVDCYQLLLSHRYLHYAIDLVDVWHLDYLVD